MENLMSKRRSAALLATAGISLGIVVTWAPSASASASIPPPSCNYSSSSTTEGAACGSGPAPSYPPYYRAYAICASGQWVYGAWENAGSWQWSYANCATIGSSLQSGGSEWAFTRSG